MRQLYLFNTRTQLTHGGTKAKGKRKTVRPLSSKLPLHLVLKASDPFRLLRNRSTIEHTLCHYADKFGITIYEIAVHADHIHLSLRIPGRELYRRWIRAVASVLTRRIAQLKWSLPPFTRIGAWGKDFKRLIEYIRHNKREGAFLIEGQALVQKFLLERSPAYQKCGSRSP